MLVLKVVSVGYHLNRAGFGFYLSLSCFLFFHKGEGCTRYLYYRNDFLCLNAFKSQNLTKFEYKWNIGIVTQSS